MLLSYDEIPEWHQDNDYIRHGYRAESRCVRACFASWLYLHNETANIFSHLIPAFVFLGAEIWISSYFKAGYPQAKPLERFIFAFFLLTAFICLALSATYHTLMNHSETVSHLWLRLDFVGIIILTLGYFVSGIYMVFYCEPTLQKVYWTMILSLGTATIFILVNPRFQGKKYRTFRVSTFVCTGFSGFAPLAHGCAIFGFSQMIEQSGMPYYIAEGLLLMLGALFYTTRIPEAIKPGRFDIFGCSHQVFHFLVVIATIVQLVGIMEAYDYNYHHRTCGPVYSVSASVGK